MDPLLELQCVPLWRTHRGAIIGTEEGQVWYVKTGFLEWHAGEGLLNPTNLEVIPVTDDESVYVTWTTSNGNPVSETVPLKLWNIQLPTGVLAFKAGFSEMQRTWFVLETAAPPLQLSEYQPDYWLDQTEGEQLCIGTAGSLPTTPPVRAREVKPRVRKRPRQ